MLRGINSGSFGHREEFFCDCTTKTDAGGSPAPNYNPDTIRGYVLAVEQFANHFDKSPQLMGVEEVSQFQLY